MKNSFFNSAFILINSLYLEDDGTDYLSIMESDPCFYYRIRSRCKAKREDDYYHAIQLFDNYIKKCPLHSLSYHYKSSALVKLRKLDDALENINRAIAMNPNNALFYNLRWAINYINNDFEGALIDINRAIELDSFFSIAIYNRAFQYYNCLMFDLAEKDLLKSIELDPKNELAYCLGSRLHYSKGNYQKALEMINMAIKLDDKYDEAYELRAKIDEKLENYEDAICYYTSCIDNSSEPLELVYLNRGVIRLKQNNLSGAIQDLAISMEISPKTDCEYHLVSALHKKTDKTEEEIQLFDIYQNAPFAKKAYNEIFDKL